MKYKHIILITAAVLLICLVNATIGCTASEERGVVSMIKNLPVSATGFNFMDYKAMLSVSPFSQEEMRGGFESEYGIYLNDLNYMISSRSYGGDWQEYEIFDGDFNLGKTRNNLDSLGYNAGEYLGIEVWESEVKSVALMKNLVIIGNDEGVRECLKVIKGEKSSLWDNQDIKELVDRLPDATSISGSIYREGVTIEGDIGQGVSMEFITEDYIRMTIVGMYIDEDAASDAMKKIEEEPVPEEIKVIDIHQDGRFVITTAEGSIEDFF